MDTAEITRPCNPAQKRAYRDILPCFRVAHLERYYGTKVPGGERCAGHGCTILQESNKPAQDIGPLLLHPEVYIRRCGRDSRPEDPAAEPALLTGFIIRLRFVH